MTRLAPAPSAARTSAATTSGLVLAAVIGARTQPMLGLISTTSPLRTKREKGPIAAMAFSVSAAGSASEAAMAISGSEGSAGRRRSRTAAPLASRRSRTGRK